MIPLYMVDAASKGEEVESRFFGRNNLYNIEANTTISTVQYRVSSG